jgi:hypothetical protein
MKVRKALGERARPGRIGSVTTAALEDKDTNVLAQNPPPSEEIDADGTPPDEKTDDVGNGDEHDDVSRTLLN